MTNLSKSKSVPPPHDIQRRYWIWASHYSTLEWKGNHEYINWINDELVKFRQEFPESFFGNSLVDHDGFTQWLESQYPVGEDGAKMAIKNFSEWDKNK